jgi:7,8-dihydropterin-6-yl-methyl-4-(beta-D-ribofuranosyl)aminobenzene 5'-phosphate synthase
MEEPGTAYGAVRRPEVDRLCVTIIPDNFYDALRPDGAVAKRFRALAGKWIHAEHGLSFYIEAVSGGRTSAFMFDYGLDTDGIKNNMDVLGIDMGKAMGFGLSHGHFDHWAGLVGLLLLNGEKVKKGTPLYLGQGAFEQRYSLVSGTNTQIGRASCRERVFRAV